MALSLASLEQIVLIDYTDPMSKAKSIFAVLSLVVCFVVPFSMSIHFRRNFKLFSNIKF